MADELTPQQERFCQEYLKDLNATKAARRAKYSEKTASEQGSRLLANVKIQSRVQELMDKRSKRTEINSDLVLQELAKLATVDLALAYNENGKLLPIHEIPEEIRRCIAGVEVFEEFEGTGAEREHIGDTVKLKLWDKTRALEMLGRHLKLFTDKVEHSVSKDLADRLADARKRRENKKP